MEPLKQSEKFITYRKDSDLAAYLRKLVFWAERFYSETAKRVNWLLKDNVEVCTSSAVLTAAKTRTVFTNLGATGTVAITLPAATRAGIKYTFAVQAAQELRVDPAVAAIRDGSGQTADKYKSANAIGDCLTIISDSNGDWITIAKSGTWTEEP